MVCPRRIINRRLVNMSASDVAGLVLTILSIALGAKVATRSGNRRNNAIICKIDKATTIFSRMILSQIVSNDLHDLINLVNVLKESETIQLNTRL